METRSFWEATTPTRPEFPKLEGNIEVDVAIIGGGITGITTALQLTKAGKKVAVLEARRIGGGTTGWSTGTCACRLVSTTRTLPETGPMRSQIP